MQKVKFKNEWEVGKFLNALQLDQSQREMFLNQLNGALELERTPDPRYLKHLTQFNWEDVDSDKLYLIYMKHESGKHHIVCLAALNTFSSTIMSNCLCLPHTEAGQVSKSNNRMKWLTALKSESYVSKWEIVHAIPVEIEEA